MQQSGQASSRQPCGSRALKEVREPHAELREVGSSPRQQVHGPYLVGFGGSRSQDSGVQTQAREEMGRDE